MHTLLFMQRNVQSLSSGIEVVKNSFPKFKFKKINKVILRQTNINENKTEHTCIYIYIYRLLTMIQLVLYINFWMITIKFVVALNK